MSDDGAASVDKPVATAQKRPAEHDGDPDDTNGEQAAKRPRQPKSTSGFASLSKDKPASESPFVSDGQSHTEGNSSIITKPGSSFLKPSALALQSERNRASPQLDSPVGATSPVFGTPLLEHSNPGSPGVRSFCLAPSILSAPNSIASSITAPSVIRKQPAAPTSNLIKDFGFGPRPLLDTKGEETDKPESPVQHENPFLQFLKVDKKSPPATSGSPSDAQSSNITGFVFGENLSDRAKISVVPATAGSSTSSSDPSSSTDGLDGSTSSKNGSSGAALRDQIVADLPASVDIVTGEEGEKNVLQVNCRLYSFDRVTHQWLERGRGTLRLNDMASAADSSGIQSSRLVMRSSGSLRLMLNCKLWAQMSCERASVKALRITVMQDSSSVEIFLVKANPRDIQQLYMALNHRLHALRQAEKSAQKSPEPEAGSAPSSPQTSSPKVEDNEKQHQSDGGNGNKEESSKPEDI